MATSGAKAAANKKSGAEEKFQATKIERSLVSRAKMIAAARKQSVGDYLSGLIREPLERDWAKEMRKVGEKAP
jgi:hypothetical protein